MTLGLKPRFGTGKPSRYDGKDFNSFCCPYCSAELSGSKALEVHLNLNPHCRKKRILDEA